MSQPILVVDDEPKIAHLVRDYLEQAGYRVTVAYDGREALAAFRHDKPRLVVLDLMLPHMDGLDVARCGSQHLADHNQRSVYSFFYRAIRENTIYPLQRGVLFLFEDS